MSELVADTASPTMCQSLIGPRFNDVASLSHVRCQTHGNPSRTFIRDMYMIYTDLTANVTMALLHYYPYLKFVMQNSKIHELLHKSP